MNIPSLKISRPVINLLFLNSKPILLSPGIVIIELTFKPFFCASWLNIEGSIEGSGGHCEPGVARRHFPYEVH